MAQTLLRQARALEEAAELPRLGPKIRASDINQIKQGISTIASLVGVATPQPELAEEQAEAAPKRATPKKAAQEGSQAAAPKKAASKKAAATFEKAAQKTKPISAAAAAAAQKAKAVSAAPKTKIQKSIGKGASRGRRNLAGIAKPELRRLARRAGVQRMASTIYDEMRGALAGFLSDVVGDVTVYAEHGRRKTATPSDVVYSLRRRGKALYGYA